MKKLLLLTCILFFMFSCTKTRVQSNSTNFSFAELPWQIGDLREDIQALEKFGPYYSIPETGALETSNGVFMGEKSDISFYFLSDSLDYMQVARYKGKNYDVAKKEWIKLYHFFNSTMGGVIIPNITTPENIDDGSMSDLVDHVIRAAPELSEKFQEDGATVNFIVDMLPEHQPKNVTLTAKLIYSGQDHAYYTFLFVDPPNYQARATENMVQVSDLKI